MFDNIIGVNEFIVLDMDIVGCYGYYVDFFWMFYVGLDKLISNQCDFYKVVYEQVYYNMDILCFGLSFCDYVDWVWDILE